jgi:vacuolar-type H+-ATPase subunit I/STV1
MRNSCIQNFETFELYVKRNIFTIPKRDVSSEITPSSSSTSTSVPNKSTELDILTEEVHKIRAKYLSLLEMRERLSNECSDNDRLLKDMRSALFHLRVGAQVLDEHSLQPLDETVKNLMDEKESLIELSSRGAQLNDEIRSYVVDSQQGTS